MMRHLLALVLALILSVATAAAYSRHRPARPVADDKTLVVYPNPSTGIVHLTINGQEGKRLELQVLNVIGTVMFRETITEFNDRFTKTLDLSRFANGLYYVKLEGSGTNQICKLLIR